LLPGRSHVPHDCRIVADVLARVGDKWSVFVVMLLGERDRRFTELLRETGGISKRMLSLTLRRLERDGLLTRTVSDAVPPAVSYGLTPLGRSLRGPIDALGHWAVDNHGSIETARFEFDASAGDRDGLVPLQVVS
jgi:DNA-binding HxlR family transcriptional regulator